MSLIVQKFGGSSVKDAQRIRNVAGIIAETYLAGNDVIVVLSAQGDTTDDLIEKANEINPHALQAGDGHAALHRRADLRGPVRHGPGGHGPALRVPDSLAGGHPVHCCPLRCPDQEDRFRAYPVRAGPAPHRHRHRLSGRGPQRRCDHSGPGRLRHQRRGPGGGLPGRPLPDLHGCGRRLHHGPPHRAGRPEAGGDHLRRDAGAGQPGRPGPPQPQRGAGQEVQSEFGSRVPAWSASPARK